jgi:RNA polymerase sigma factor (sigma-70 family)
MERTERTGDFSFDALTPENWGALRGAALRFARLWCPRHEDAEDIAHEALLAFIGRANAVHKPLDWLFIAIRRIAHKANRAASRSVLMRDDGVTDARTTVTPTLENSHDVLTRFLYDRTLSPRERRILALSMLGYSQREVARRVGQSQSAVSRSLTGLARRVEQPSATSHTRRPHH